MINDALVHGNTGAVRDAASYVGPFVLVGLVRRAECRCGDSIVVDARTISDAILVAVETHYLTPTHVSWTLGLREPHRHDSDSSETGWCSGCDRTDLAVTADQPPL